MTLIPITAASHGVTLDIAYATPCNFTGKPVYAKPLAFLHPEAAAKLGKAIALARGLGLTMRIFDAFRPSEAQWVLWNHTPDPNFLADPRKGSPHSRGAAVDLTLIGADGVALDMGTGFDEFTPLSHHASTGISTHAQQNRFLLLGLMSAAGWDFYGNEWWHYQLFDAKKYPVLGDADAPERMMPEAK